MKKYITLALTLIGCVFLLVSCQSDNTVNLQIKNEINPKTIDAADIAEEAVAPMYLPQELNGKKANLSYEKTGLIAAIKADETVLASFTFSKIEGEDADYPSTVGQANVSQSDDKVTIRYRMSDSWVCEVGSEQISKKELEKVINSLTVRSGP